MTPPPLRPATAGALLIFVLTLAGCRGPTATISEHGFPAFAEVVGADVQLERPDPHQTQGMDAFGDDVQSDADHRFSMRFWPLSSEERVAIEVKAHPQGRLPVEEIAVAVYPVSRIDAERFGMRGVLPDPDAAPLAFARGGELDAEGNLVLVLLFPREAVPAGTERLAVPTLVRFRDGWVHVRYYHTAVPAPLRRLSPEEVKAFKQRQAAAAAASSAAPPAAPPSAAPLDAPTPTPAAPAPDAEPAQPAH